MDPIYYQVNQTRLTEVTQKTSDNLRLQGNKEAKRKAEKAGDVDKAAMSTDSSSMSDDMLGNMDPDDYGGRGAKQFAQMWKEQMEDDEDEPEPEEEGEGEEEPEEPEDKAAPNKEEIEVEGLATADQNEAVVEGKRVEAPAPSSTSVVSEPEKAQEPAVREQAARPEAPAKEQRAAVTPPTSASEARAAKEQAPGAEKFSASKAPAAPAEVSSAPVKKSSLGSLLDFSSGYLIAEDAHFDENAAEETAAQEAEPEAALPEEISYLLERLITGDNSQPGFRKLSQLLSRFGRRVLQQCLEAHAKVYLLPPGEPLLAHPLLAACGSGDLQGAAYLPEQRLCLVEDECVSQPPRGFHPVFYYFAHLWDHAMGGELFASSKSAAVFASYQVCLEGGHRFGDLMSSHSPAHYFAQAVESYLTENDCFEPLWTRQDLYDFDRSIYDYIEYLLK